METYWREEEGYDLKMFSFSIKVKGSEGKIEVLLVLGSRNERGIMQVLKRSDIRISTVRTLGEGVVETQGG